MSSNGKFKGVKLIANTALNTSYQSAARSNLHSNNSFQLKNQSRACTQALRNKNWSSISLRPSLRALHQSLCTPAFKRRFASMGGQQILIWVWDYFCLITRFFIDMPWFVRPKLKNLITVKVLYQNHVRWVIWRNQCLQKMEAQQMPWERQCRISLTRSN